MIFSKINPYMWDDSSDDVTSPVAEFKLVECPHTAARRQKRQINTKQPLGDDIELELTLEIREPSYANASEPDAFGLVYQEMNVTDPPKPIQLSVFPLGKR